MMIRIYFIGVAILIIAIIANGLVVKLGIKSWYDFIELLTKKGAQAFKITLVDYFWLFIGYPFILGLGYWIGNKIYSVIF